MIKKNEKMKKNLTKTLAVILAGGHSSRMQGENKVFLKLNHKTIIEHVIDKTVKMKPDFIVISANHDLDKLKKFTYPLVCDLTNDYSGPLAGVLAAMHWAKQYKPKIQYLLSIACDTPFFPDNLLEKLVTAIETDENTELCLAACPNKIHPVFSLHKISLYEKLKDSLLKQKKRKIMFWAQNCKYQIVRFEQTICQNQTPFFNINTKEQLDEAKIIAQHEQSS